MIETGPADSSEPRVEHPAKERMHKGKSDNKNLFIRKVIICEPPFEAVQLNIQYL